MDIYLFSSLSTIELLVGAAYLGIWLVRGATWLYHAGQGVLARRSVAGRLKQMSASDIQQDDAWLGLAGLALGAGLAYLLARWLPADRAMLIGLVASLALEELRPPHGLETLPAVIALLNACRANQEKPILAAFEGIKEQLPNGVVRDAVAQALRAYRMGISSQECLRRLAAINPFLDEFLAEAQYAGWQAGPTLHVVLEPLIRKATREWERTAKMRRFFEQAEIYLYLARYATVGALALAFLQEIGGGNMLMNSTIPQLALGFAVVVVLGAGCHVALSRSILRRTLLVTALVLLGLIWMSPTPDPVQALQPTPTSTVWATHVPTKTAIMAIGIPTNISPVLPTATSPHHPAKVSPTSTNHPQNAATVPVLPTSTSPMMVTVPARTSTATPLAPPVPTATAPELDQEIQLTAPALPKSVPTAPILPGG
jgi:hypothetical protein